MNIKKVHLQTAWYAIQKRVYGYHLLKNPKGTSPTEVNMVQIWNATSSNGDKVSKIWRIKKSFNENGHESLERRFLSSTHYFDHEKNQITKPIKKDIIFDVRKDGEFVKGGVRHDIPMEEAIKIKHNPLISDRYENHSDTKVGKSNFFKVLYQNLTNK